MKKKIWLMIEADVIIENGKEVVDQEANRPLAATFNHGVAEKILSTMKKYSELNDKETMVMSDINPLPVAILDVLEPEMKNSLLEEIAALSKPV